MELIKTMSISDEKGRTTLTALLREDGVPYAPWLEFSEKVGEGTYQTKEYWDNEYHIIHTIYPYLIGQEDEIGQIGVIEAQGDINDAGADPEELLAIIREGIKMNFFQGIKIPKEPFVYNGVRIKNYYLDVDGKPFYSEDEA